jgi:magnesium dechelatase
MQLDPGRLHVTFAPGASPEEPVVPRAYTLTHSDVSGELFLTIGPAVGRRQVSGWYTRLMRDEVLAAWTAGDGIETTLDIHCHVSGGLVVGTARWRYGILKSHMRLVLEAFRYGDRDLFIAHPDLDQAPARVHFHSRRRRYDLMEDWGRLGDYR